jgi:hypothetical protein
MWKDDYFICEECYTPLLNNVLGVERTEIDRVKTEIKVDNPILNQFYDLLNVPEPLRFNTSDSVLNHRNDIFNHNATALVNVTKEAVESQIELYQVMLFNLKLNLEPLAQYIDRVKAHEREQNNIEGVKKGRAEATKGPSKTKLSAMEKEAKSLGLSLEKYQEMVKRMKELEFNKVVGNEPSTDTPKA